MKDGSFKMTIHSVGDQCDVDIQWNDGKDEGPLDPEELMFRSMFLLGIFKISIKKNPFERIADPEEREAIRKSFLDRIEALEALVEQNDPDSVREEALEKMREIQEDFHKIYPELVERSESGE
jgi:hypothetical protein